MPFLDDIIARLKLDTGQYDQAAKGAAAKPGMVQSAWQKMASRFVFTAGDVVNAVKSISNAMVGMIERGGAVGDVMAATTIDIAHARDATRGLVSDFDLASKANAAAAAGLNLTQRQFEAMSKAALILSQKTGVDASSAFEQLLRSVTAAESRGLKQFGIALDAVDPKLSAQEQLLARQVQAVDKFVQKYGEARVAVDDAGESLTQASVAWRNLKDAMATATAESDAVIGAIQIAADWLNALSGPDKIDRLHTLNTLLFEDAELVNALRDEQAQAARAAKTNADAMLLLQAQAGALAIEVPEVTKSFDALFFTMQGLSRFAEAKPFLPNLFPPKAEQERIKGLIREAGEAREAAFERARSLIVDLPAEVTPEQDLSAVRGRAQEMREEQAADEIALEKEVDGIREEMRERERARQEQRLIDQASATAAWNATVRAETIAGAQAVGALALQAFLARKSFQDFSQAVAQLFLQKALMHSIEAGILAAASAIPTPASPVLWAQAGQNAQIAAAYAAAAGLFGAAGGGIGRAPAGAGIRRGGGSVSVGTGGGGGVGLGFGAGRGGGGGSGTQTTIINNIRVEPGASPEDTGEAVVRSIRAYERDRGRRVIGA